VLASMWVSRRLVYSNMRSLTSVRLLCSLCLRSVLIAEVDGDREVRYSVPERPSAKGFALRDVGPSVRLAGSMADITAGLAALREWEPKMTETGEWLHAGKVVSRTFVLPAHFRCPADLRLRLETVDALVRVAVGAGETSAILPA